MNDMNDRILKQLNQLFPTWTLDYISNEMGAFETKIDEPIYFFSDKTYWKNTEISFQQIKDSEQVIYIPNQEYVKYQERVMNLLEKELSKKQIDRNILDLKNELQTAIKDYGFNKKQILEYSGRNTTVGSLIFEHCNGNYPFTEYSLLNDAHEIGNYKGMIFKTFGKRPEEYIYETMYSKEYPDVSFVNFLQNDYKREAYIKTLIETYQKRNIGKFIIKPKEKELKSDIQKDSGVRYRYYSDNRPIQMGGIPGKNLVEYLNFEQKELLPNFTKKVWGYVEYSTPLTDEQISNYELLSVEDLSPIIRSEKTEQNILKTFALGGGWDNFEKHNNELVEKLMIIEDMLSEFNQKDEVFVVGSWLGDSGAKNTGVDYVSTFDSYYNDMQDLNFKNGIDLMVDNESQSIILYGYGSNYTKTIEGIEFDGMDYERREYNFVSSKNLPKSIRNKVIDMLEKEEGFASLTTDEYKMLAKYNDLNRDIMARLITDEDDGELAGTMVRIKEKEDYGREL